MPRIRIKNVNKQYKVAARFFNPDKLDQEEEPTHVKFKRRQTELAAKTLSTNKMFRTLSGSPGKNRESRDKDLFTLQCESKAVL